MRAACRSVIVIFLGLLGAVVIGIASTMTAGFTLAATTALIMGGTGTPSPKDEPGYVPNVSSYYIFPNTACHADNCELVSVMTPEQAWPLYGGLSALTWRDSILQGVADLDTVVQPRVAALQPGDHLIIFGYSQSGAIVAFEKRRLAALPVATQQQIQWVVIGDVSRPNGGLNVRLPLSIPIVNFPFGPPVPTDTEMQTTDIAMKWDIIADAPLYATNPLAMLNALLGGPGVGIIHGTYPNPDGVPPTGLVGGYTQAEWQAIMNDPEAYAAVHPDVVNVQTFGDTTYITVTPKVLPLVQPLHSIGLTPLADLLEPALRVIIEETGYDRSIPYGQPTPFRLIPVFDPVKLADDLAVAIPEGISRFLADLGAPTPLAPTIAPTAPAPSSPAPSDSGPTDPAPSGPASPSMLAAAETVEPQTATADTDKATASPTEPTSTPKVSTSTPSGDQSGTTSATAKTDPAPANNNSTGEPEETTGTGTSTTTAGVTTPSKSTAPAATKPKRPKVWSKIGSHPTKVTPAPALTATTDGSTTASTATTGGGETAGAGVETTTDGAASTGAGSSVASGSSTGSATSNAAKARSRASDPARSG